MSQITQAQDITLEELQDQFGLQSSGTPGAFSEWQDVLPSPSPFERQQLKRMQQNYANLAWRRNFSEEAIKMVVLSPLLDLASLYQAPFEMRTEEAVELTSEDEGFTLRGKIDVLVI